MNLETLFEKFDQLSDAPNALTKIRELVLRLAFTGGLSGNRPAKGGIPSGWECRTVESISSSIAPGFACSKTHQVERGHVHLRTHNISTLGTLNFDLLIRIDPNFVDKKRNSIQAGDILFNNTNSQELVGKTCLVDRNYNYGFSNHITRIRLKDGVFPGFVVFYFTLLRNSGHFARLCTRWINQAAVNTSTLKEQTILLPPIDEQMRIVAKVDELMAMCDKLEAQQQERTAKHAALVSASLNRFADAPTPANLSFLFHSSYPIPPDDLRKTISNLAIQGKLVSQDVADEPTSKLLNRLVLLTAEGGKVPKSLKPIDTDALPFELPSTWAWVQAQDLSRPPCVITYGILKPVWVDSGVPTVRVKDIQNGVLLTDNIGQCSKERAAKFGKTTLEFGDLLIAKDGGTLGKTAFVPPALAGGNITQHVMRFPITPEANRVYVRLVVDSPHGQKWMRSETKGVGLPGVNVEDFRRLPIPLPPLAEQKRIVSKVESLMILVDQLEAELAASRVAATNLLSSLIAELIGTEQPSDPKQPSGEASSMKTKKGTPKEHREKLSPLNLSTSAFVLRRFAMTSGYRSLGEFDCTYHSEEGEVNEASPICLVGLNGSGKSNLIEAIAEVFCFLELINLPWKRLKSDSSRYRENGHLFELEYTLVDNEGERLIRIRKTKKKGAEFYVVNADGIEEVIESGRPQLLVLPRRIVGYSSGLNETVSHPFLRTRTIYSEEVRDAAPPEGVQPTQDDSVFDTRTLYMDYESNAAILICNYIFRELQELVTFDRFTRVRGVSSFGVRFNRHRAGRTGTHKNVRLTSELLAYQQKFALCAQESWDPNQPECHFKFQLDSATLARFREEFETAENLFMAMHKWSLLNALILSEEQRKVYLSNDITKGALERPPSVPPSDRVFNIVDLKLLLSEPRIEIDYSGLSDGEHQFIQIFGTALLFSAPGTLFLFDEPESHFNPEWRTRFNLILNGLPNASGQEYIISTHSPFVVSGSRRGNVFKFKRTGGDIKCTPVQFETYGASFDILLKNLFSVDSLIDQSARQELEQIIKRGDTVEMREAVEDFAESKEKRRLYEAIIQKEAKE